MILPKEYYPTPKTIARKMRDKVNMESVTSILEPSAGDGNLVDEFTRALMINKSKYQKELDYSGVDIDAIEIDDSLRAILKDKGVRVVYDDFLNYITYKQYDLIAMNPPFSNGDKHLLKALDMQKNGGQIICLLNAETLKNPFSNIRKDLISQLEKYEADIEYIDNAFMSSDRKTDVEIALVYVNIPQTFEDCDILKNLERAKEIISEQQEEETHLTDRFESYLNAIVRQYEAESAAGVQLIREYLAFSPKCLKSLSDTYPIKILELKIIGERYTSIKLVNHFIKEVRYKYWSALFNRKELSDLMTQSQQTQYQKQLDELADYEFNLSNIKQIQLDLSKSSIKSIEDTILDLFEEFAITYSWYKECNNNIHYYNGWATNKVGYINKKVIIRLDAFGSYNKRFKPAWSVNSKISDIEKVLNFLDGGYTEFDNVRTILERAEKDFQTAKIEFKYFHVTFFKKGTAHIWFKDLELIKRFNIFVGRKKSGLPPSYGKKAYKDMNVREKEIIDEFEGEKEYNKVCQNTQKYIIESDNLLALDYTGD